MIASIQISPEPNQSFCSPRSSRIWSAPIRDAQGSEAQPNRASRPPLRVDSRRRKHGQAGPKVRRANGQVDVEHVTPAIIIP